MGWLSLLVKGERVPGGNVDWSSNPALINTCSKLAEHSKHEYVITFQVLLFMSRDFMKNAGLNKKKCFYNIQWHCCLYL